MMILHFFLFLSSILCCFGLNEAQINEQQNVAENVIDPNELSSPANVVEDDPNLFLMNLNTDEPLQRKRRAPEKDGSGKNKQAQKDKNGQGKQTSSNYMDLESPGSALSSVRRSDSGKSPKKVPRFAESPASSSRSSALGRNKQIKPSLNVDISSNSDNSVEEILQETQMKNMSKVNKPVKDKATKDVIIEKEEPECFYVKKILAMYVCHDDEKSRLFYIDWEGYPDDESWQPSRNIYSQELVADFIEYSTIMCAVHALSGKESVPEHIAEELRENEKFKKLMKKIGKNEPFVIKTEANKIVFAEDITKKQKENAQEEIKDFLMSQKLVKEAVLFERRMK
ncbi:hypothetical protein niasHT_014187 [Heterodera trifolii]|uniref:Chromo domain-containing protein n=1 Tax=Heterodera trifolii TaxID=157864 RepID=A0ABD2KY06_9BILA